MDINEEEYITPETTKQVVEFEGAINASSVETKEQEFKGHTQDYETENFNWDTISFN